MIIFLRYPDAPSEQNHDGHDPFLDTKGAREARPPRIQAVVMTKFACFRHEGRLGSAKMHTTTVLGNIDRRPLFRFAFHFDCKLTAQWRCTHGLVGSLPKPVTGQFWLEEVVVQLDTSSVDLLWDPVQLYPCG